MGRDITTVEEQTNGEKEVVTKIITENELTNFKLDEILRLLRIAISEKEEPEKSN